MNKKLLVLTALALLLITACKKEEEVQEDKGIPVNVYKVQADTISEYIRLTGSVTGENDASVYSKISEKLEQINVKPGQSVSTGDVMAVQYNAVLKQSVEMAKAAIKTAQAQYDLANQDYERMNELFSQKALSPQQFDQAKTQKETAETALEQAKLQLDQANENYQNSFIKAPFDGVVGAVFFERDQMVPAGQQVVQVVSANSMKSKLQISSRDIASVSVGQEVVINFPSIPGKEYLGKVTKINHAINPVSNLLEIEVQIVNPDKNVRSGIFGEFLIETITKKGTLVVPENALMQRTEIAINKRTGVQETIKKHLIYVVKEGVAKLTEVKTGIGSDGRMEVVDGLTNEDTVIVVGQNIVRDGQKVKVVE